MTDVIDSPRLLLKPFSPADADEAYPCITPSLTRYMVSEPPASPDEFAASWRAWIQARADGTECVFTVREKLNNQFLGLAGLGRTHTPNPELGIWIRESRQGSGFGCEAVTCLYQWASANFDYACFIYPVAEDNSASRRIAELLGGVVTKRGTAPKCRYVVYSIARPCPASGASVAKSANANDIADANAHVLPGAIAV
jgi:RimJ/RimL family protein N-acetyltransferase